MIIQPHGRRMATINYMETWISALILMMACSSAAKDRGNITTDLAGAIEDMRKANYFTFVVLINLASPEFLQGNLTFLMPRDKTLSGNTMMLQSSVTDFLRGHSIPSPLLFEHLQRFPTGSILPTSKPGLFLNITNNGGSRRNFFLNNVRITNPNICTCGSSIRCHGIDGVIQPLQLPSTWRHNIPPPPGAVKKAPFLVVSPSPTVTGLTLDPSTALPPSNSSQPKKSGCQPQLMIKSRDFTILKTCLMFLAVKLSM